MGFHGDTMGWIVHGTQSNEHMDDVDIMGVQWEDDEHTTNNIQQHHILSCPKMGVNTHVYPKPS